ncbi:MULTISPECIES: hypothetical protein [Pseudofrankia]|uniref:hypothetical protein n=1 Tax=Pseudofrankia TaxID=2994363 RepID=UPI000234BF6F|nr:MULTISPECIES: hypothetical protein [Pseudofrankia]OHV31234.1 hypothetical protein BCD49_32435 [Pseudofrankia sp. EUN1h]
MTAARLLQTAATGARVTETDAGTDAGTDAAELGETSLATARLLSTEEADEVRADVYRERPAWLDRGHAFHTLGTPSYLDLAPEARPGEYDRLAALHRPLLRNRFGRLYDRLGATLTELLAAPVRYTDTFALPGFHLWRTEAIFLRPRAPVHFDLQYQFFDWPGTVDRARVLSFTLPLRMPVAGGGLNTWDVGYESFLDAQRRGWIDGAGDLRRFHPLRYVPYTAGELVVHSGHLLHQVAPSPSVSEGDERLTLQGHGIWNADHWLLYW